MASIAPPRSILKKPTPPVSSSSSAPSTSISTQNTPPPKKSNISPRSSNTLGDASTIISSFADQLTSSPPVARNRRHSPEEARRIAIYHANIIQNQKNLELSILGSIELLMEYPTTENPASEPSADDVAVFKKNLIHFRPSDYDDLIEERNISSKCGYALCPCANNKQPTKAKFKFTSKGMVETKLLERFCSEECARRGLWVRVQLNDEPAWQRIGPDGLVGKGGIEYRITLLEEEKRDRCWNKKDFQGSVNKLSEQLQEIGITDTGFTTTGSIPRPPSMEQQQPVMQELTVRIVEAPTSRDPATSPQAPTIDDGLSAKMAAFSLEGYNPGERDLSDKWKAAVAKEGHQEKSGLTSS